MCRARTQARNRPRKRGSLTQRAAVRPKAAAVHRAHRVLPLRNVGSPCCSSAAPERDEPGVEALRRMQRTRPFLKTGGRASLPDGAPDRPAPRAPWRLLTRRTGRHRPATGQKRSALRALGLETVGRPSQGVEARLRNTLGDRQLPAAAKRKGRLLTSRPEVPLSWPL